MTRVYFFKLSYYYLSIVILSMCSFFRVSRNAFLRPESVCKVTALFCLCQKVRQCLTLFNLSAPRLACRRRHSRKASAKVRPFSSTAKFFRTFFRGFFCQSRPSNTQNAIIPQYSTTNIFYGNNGSDGNNEDNGNNGNNGSDGKATERLCKRRPMYMPKNSYLCKAIGEGSLT